MADAKVDANTISYSAAISACEKGGKCVRALELLLAMADAKAEANTISCWLRLSATMPQSAHARRVESG
eukprot:4319060-Prorocentrum_lima.AAC.1